MSSDGFDVIQFLADGSRERVREGVPGLEAMKAARHYCTCVAAQLGVVRRVVIIDDDDCCNFEWRFGQGVVFPRPADIGEALQ
jgi:hypothetical protein